jgi:hypothetical protein
MTGLLISQFGLVLALCYIFYMRGTVAGVTCESENSSRSWNDGFDKAKEFFEGEEGDNLIEMRKDAARLDWWEAHPLDVGWRQVSEEPLEIFLRARLPERLPVYGFKTFRDAIDHGMQLDASSPKDAPAPSLLPADHPCRDASNARGTYCA